MQESAKYVREPICGISVLALGTWAVATLLLANFQPVGTMDTVPWPFISILPGHLGPATAGAGVALAGGACGFGAGGVTGDAPATGEGPGAGGDIAAGGDPRSSTEK
mmetsp:Transcript_99925/g.278275  ORF Transcript_99925/g.278275 Transcript_99925/m.278275 type:complete len:107 (+) Transcript_99925:1190-1510(+)